MAELDSEVDRRLAWVRSEAGVLYRRARVCVKTTLADVDVTIIAREYRTRT
jgi:hypothetical protein